MKHALPRGRPPGFIRKTVRPGALVAARQRAGMTGTMAASLLSTRRRVAVSASTLYAWERNENAPPDWAVISLAKMYDTDPEALWQQNLPL